MQVHDKFQALSQDLNTALIERQAAIQNALLALVTREHFLMLGPPGTAKSMLVNALHERIDGANKFRLLMAADTVRDELFGPVDLVAYADRGQYTRIAHHTLDKAHIAFLDEVYKSNSYILNALLSIMNERILYEADMPAPTPVPLISLFGASNEVPQDDSLDALDDRFLIRDVIPYIQDDSAFVQMLTAKPDAAQITIALQDIEDAQQQVGTVTGTREAMEAVLDIKHQLASRGIVASDRRWRGALKVIKASAWLDGRDKTEIKDVCALASVLWRDPKDKRTVEAEVYRMAVPLACTAMQLEDMAEEIMNSLPKQGDSSERDALENVLQQLDDIRTDLESRAGSNPEPRVAQALTNIGALHYQAASRYRIFLRDLGIKDKAHLQEAMAGIR